MKILVTGGAGFIGSHVADRLIEEGHDVVIVDNLITGLMSNVNKKAKFYCYNLGCFDKLDEVFREEKPEIVFHLAAQINVRTSVENPVFDAKMNILNSLNLLELCRKFDVSKFIFSSTGGAIYGDAEEVPTPEGFKESPISPYGCAKLAIEKYINFYNQVYGLDSSVLRYSNVYGERQNPHGEAGVVAIFFNNMFAGERPVIFGGHQTRDFVYVQDVVDSNMLSINDKKNEIYNVGTGIETNIMTIFSNLNRFFGNKFNPEFKEQKKGEQKKSCLSYQKINESLGWIPKVSLDEGLKRTYLWYKENLKKGNGL